MNVELKYMERALTLAGKGMGGASPNPMVGAVIVHSSGRIIGEGYHRRCGEGHAEVNAVASVKDPSMLADSTMYVTLEPCSHWGKTPPCAKLIIDKKIPRVVVGTLDPFPKVSGRGVDMLREAGVEVEVLSGDMERKCRETNRRFMTAHTLKRPFVTLKWAQSADGYMDRLRKPGQEAQRFSTPLTSLMVHRLRALHDAIITGSGTVMADNPRFDVRGWKGRQPAKIVLDRKGRLAGDEALFHTPGPVEVIRDSDNLSQLLGSLYEKGITSVLVEAGPTLLQAFIDEGLWDTARVEISPKVLGVKGAAKAPAIPAGRVETRNIDGNIIELVLPPLSRECR